MRTTITIQDEALELCRKEAGEKGMTIGEVITKAIFSAYRGRPKQARPQRFTLPASGKGGLRPGVDLDSSAGLEDIMEGRA